jgi:hypothetical protein
LTVSIGIAKPIPAFIDCCKKFKKIRCREGDVYPITFKGEKNVSDYDIIVFNQTHLLMRQMGCKLLYSSQLTFRLNSRERRLNYLD